MKISNRPLMRVDGFLVADNPREKECGNCFREKKEKKTWKEDYLRQNQ